MGSVGIVGALVFALLGNVDIRAPREALLEVGEHLIEPRDLLVDVEIRNVFEDSIVDDIESFRPGVVQGVERIGHWIDDHRDLRLHIGSVGLRSSHALLNGFVL